MDLPSFAEHLLQQYGYSLSVNIFAKEDADIKERNATLRERKGQRKQKREHDVQEEDKAKYEAPESIPVTLI